MNSRRAFLRNTGFGFAALTTLGTTGSAAVAANPASPTTAAGIKLGMASYTIRKFPLDQALAMVARLGLQRMVFKSDHLALNSTDDQIKQAIAQAHARGIEVYGGGTVYMKTAAEVDQAFHYAQTAGMKMIIGAPNVDLLPLVEQKVKATDIWLAIHNHGPDNPLYSSPLDAYELVKNLDRRMGLCLDIGHTQRFGLDPVAVFKTVFDRTFDVHIKDVSAATKAGKTVEIGRGVIDIVGFLKTVVALKYAHTLDFEHEKDDADPLPGVAESIGYVRGVLKMLGA